MSSNNYPEFYNFNGEMGEIDFSLYQTQEKKSQTELNHAQAQNHSTEIDQLFQPQLRPKVQADKAQQANVQTINTRRMDPHCKCIPQNISSTCCTIISKILSNSCKAKAKEIRTRLKSYLKQHKANNNQLILFFVYFFLIKEDASQAQFIRFKFDLLNYLDKRIKESEYFEPQEREIYIQRININKTIIQKYMDGSRAEIDTEWIMTFCANLFTGRQKNTIAKPLKELQKIQNSLTGTNNQFLNESSSDIEKFFESNSEL